ncbi:MAG: hypothetical protein C0405_13100 [Desulfovibrio sp.]|nr:hypothetical protein [Desulfovibrio sp.]
MVGKSDNVWSISKKYNVSVKTLLAANGLTNSKGIKPGLRLSIPDASAKDAKKTRVQAAKAREQATRYTVRQGDTVQTVSRKFGVTAEALKDWNNIRKGGLKPGDNLRVSMR